MEISLGIDKQVKPTLPSQNRQYANLVSVYSLGTVLTEISEIFSFKIFSIRYFLFSLKASIRVLVTGAAGQIAYSLLYPIAKGDVFGADQVCINILKNIVKLNILSLLKCDSTNHFITCHFSFIHYQRE